MQAKSAQKVFGKACCDNFRRCCTLAVRRTDEAKSPPGAGLRAHHKISGVPHCTQGSQPDRGRLRQLELSARCAACPSSHMLADLLQAARPPALHTVGIRVQPPRLVGRPHSLDSSDKHDRPQPHNSCTTAACSGLPVLLMAVHTVRPSPPPDGRQPRFAELAYHFLAALQRRANRASAHQVLERTPCRESMPTYLHQTSAAGGRHAGASSSASSQPVQSSANRRLARCSGRAVSGEAHCSYE